jgi:hypothetical protein
MSPTSESWVHSTEEQSSSFIQGKFKVVFSFLGGIW